MARNKISGGNDDAGQKLQSVYDKNTEKDCANQAKKHSKKKKKDEDGAKDDNDDISTQKKQRIQWSDYLHEKFLINEIGMDSKCSLFIALLST